MYNNRICYCEGNTCYYLMAMADNIIQWTINRSDAMLFRYDIAEEYVAMLKGKSYHYENLLIVGGIDD